MKITDRDVAHVAALARLQFDRQETEVLTRQLNSILLYFEKLQEVDTTDVAPATHAVDVCNAFRNDEPGLSLPAESALQNAPDREQTCFRVPKIIEV